MISRTTHPNYARTVLPIVDTPHGRNCNCRTCTRIYFARMAAQSRLDATLAAFRKNH